MPESPPGDLRHALTEAEWESIATSGQHVDWFLEDLRRIAVDGADPNAVVDVPESAIDTEIYKVRSRFESDRRPAIGYRGQLMKRDGREIA